LPRLFISHSSKDNVVAVAFKQWLGSSGWAGEDVFLDLDDLGAGERWKEALHKANARCEAVILLASPSSLTSPECLAEVRKAEDFGKEIIVLLLNDVEFDDRRLDSYKDRQIVQLAVEPQAHTETITYRGDSHDVGFNADALAKIKDYLIRRGIAPEQFAWPPRDRPNAEPFPGLAAFTEDDAGIFFGRDSDILRGLDKLRILRRNRRPRLLVIQAASGAGKSSFLRAGLWPRLKRDPDFAPLAILRPAQGILTGPDGLGHKLAPLLARPAAPVNPGDIHPALAADDLARSAEAFLGLMTSAAKQAHEARRIGDRTARPPALVLAVDQAEELFAAEDAAESSRFLGLLAGLLRDAADTLELFVLATIRADSADRLLQAMAARGVEVSETLSLLPLPATSYRDVILKPIEVLARRGQRIVVEPALADRLAADATGADSLPLLAFTLARLYRDFHASGSLTLAQYETMGGVGGSIDKALKDALAGAGAAGTDGNLRRLIVPGLATWDPAANAAKRLVARETDVAGGDRASLAPLADALVEARLLTRGGKTLEVAHEALLRRDPIAGWLEAQKDALKLRDDILREAKEWVEGGRYDKDLVRRGPRLAAALRLQANPDFASVLAPAREYLRASKGTAWYSPVIGLGAVLLLVAVFLVPDVYFRVEWLADWRTALLSDRLPTSHPKIAIVRITEASVVDRPHWLPVDRSFIADIIDAVDKAGARAIGLDFYFSRETVRELDEKLRATLRRSRDKLVVGAFERIWPKHHREYQYDFIGDTPAGYIDLRPDVDHIVRYRANPWSGARYHESFSSRLARAGGWTGAEPPERIGWLLPPADGSTTFLTVEAHKLVKATRDEYTGLLKDRIVLIGGDLYTLDRHWTPLSIRSAGQTVGVEVHAQMVAELIDGRRSFKELEPETRTVYLMVLAVLGIALGLRFQERKFDFLDWRLVSLGVIAVDLITFKFFYLVLPFTHAVIAWGAAIATGTRLRLALAWWQGRWGGR
jgi:CHASE2 domain-containing sensor protein